MTAVAGSTPPALHYADRFTVPQFAVEGFFTNISDFAEAAGVTKELYFDFAWEETVYKVVSMHYLSTPILALSGTIKDIMAEAGVDPESPPTNLDELRAATKALTIRDSTEAYDFTISRLSMC